MSIKSAREKAGRTVKEVADIMHVTPSAVYQWEGGWCNPEIGKLISLAAFLGCPVEELLRKDEEATNAAQ